ncbi:MAG TPA: amino acid ABC transporter permease [Bauldia sp.]|nr:amino acid ABC transporter permease [Bauldia sp.]
MDYTLNFGAVTRGLDNLLGGLLLGLEMGLAGLAIGSVIGVVAALAAVYGGRPARVIVAAYVGLVRNVPILVLALFAFFALPRYGIRFSNVVTFAAVLAVYAGAYLTESFRAAILVIPKGINEAAASIGLTRTGTAIWVILPIALRNALPSVGNNFISLFKDTSIAAVIAVPELTFQARKINNESFRVIEVWLVASFIYVATCALIAAGLRGLERLFPKF